jgi:elongation factor P--(R)-beta-lysine ligase
VSWEPAAGLGALRRRAEVLARIRTFFASRNVLEVETPVLAAAGGTDVHLAPLHTYLADGRRLYLQTSPEFAMKRLLAAGSGPIYQLGRAFRDGEVGRRHNPEFTMLEWYRPGWDHHALMDEVDALLAEVLGTAPGERLSYREALRHHAGFDPFATADGELRERAAGLGLAADDVDRDGCLSLILGAVVEPRLGRGRPTFVIDFPASQAALARIRQGDPPLAERFEAYVEGVEIANGYHELTDPGEQRRRFEADLAERRRRGLPDVPLDERLLAALEHGLPDCAGVALGVDRLVMLACGASSLAEVMAFPIDRA